MYSEMFKPESELRRQKIQTALRNAKADALLLVDNADLYYVAGRVFCGYAYIPVEGEMLCFVRRPVGLKGDNVVYIRKPEQIAEELRSRGVAMPSCLLLEGDTLSFNEYNRLAAIFPDSKVSGEGTALIRQVRAVKTPYEIAKIRQSAAMHDTMYRRIPKYYAEGMTDIEFAIELEHAARQHGSLGIFRIFGHNMEIYMGNVLVGENADNPSPYDFAMGGAGLDTSLPVSCNGTAIRRGQTVMVDMNGNFTGYMSDLSRVFSVGNVPDKARRVHGVSIRIQEAVAAMARPGVAAADLYHCAAEIAKEEHVEEYFMGHRQKAGFIGHGVGIEVNELPVIAPRSRDVLQEGMVIALEPKFVLPEIGAVGVENTFLVTADGMEKLTTCTEDIVRLD